MDFDLEREIAQLHEEEAWVRTGRNSKTLVKQPDFRIVLMAMKKGGHLEKHSADARVSIHTITGHVESLTRNLYRASATVVEERVNWH